MCTGNWSAWLTLSQEGEEGLLKILDQSLTAKSRKPKLFTNFPFCFWNFDNLIVDVNWQFIDTKSVNLWNFQAAVLYVVVFPGLLKAWKNVEHGVRCIESRYEIVTN